MNPKSGVKINGYLLETKLSDSNHPVWLAYELTTERVVTLKFIEDKRLAARERNLMVDVDHPNIVKLLTLFEYERWTVLVLEYKQGASLTQIWKDLDKASGHRILSDIASAILAIHKAGLWHGDISHHNVIWAEDQQRAYLIDFAYEGKCALGFQAPEDFDHHPEKVDSRTDVFRFGKLIELLRPDLIRRFKDCLEENPENRPSIAEIGQRLDRKRSRVIVLPAMCVIAAISFFTIFCWIMEDRPTSPTHANASQSEPFQNSRRLSTPASGLSRGTSYYDDLYLSTEDPTGQSLINGVLLDHP